MIDKEKIALAWSGGKDSAMALYELRRSGRYDVVSLFTTVAAEYDRVSHHGVRAPLLRLQASAIGLPVEILYLEVTAPGSCQPGDDSVVMGAYERLMGNAMLRYQQAGVQAIAFGDIFLERLRAYREKSLAKIGMNGVFPIWRRDTRELLETFLKLRFKAYVACVDAQKLGSSFAGRTIDEDFLRDLPAGVDPCGEFGEYHSFVYDGPIFNHPVGVSLGEVVRRRDQFFADLLPLNAPVEIRAGIA